ncbi:MAG TPA: hypothetical protein VGK67_01285 [Myxococcales bacterium]
MPVASRLAASFLPRTAVLEMTYRCNHVCLFCSCPWSAPGEVWTMAEKQTCENGIREKIRTGKSITPTDANTIFADEPQILEKYFGPPAPTK